MHLTREETQIPKGCHYLAHPVKTTTSYTVLRHHGYWRGYSWLSSGCRTPRSNMFLGGTCPTSRPSTKYPTNRSCSSLSLRTSYNNARFLTRSVYFMFYSCIGN